jgi:hypothetical protein
MLVLHHLLHVLFTLCGVFMWFPELTYWQDATVQVPYFLPFLCFRKATQEIFSELEETKFETPILPGGRTRTEREPEGGQRAPSPWGGMPPLGPRGPVVWWPWPTSDAAFSPIKSLGTKNPKLIGDFREKSSAAPPPPPMNFGGQKSLFRHLAGMGKCPRSHLHWRL